MIHSLQKIEMLSSTKIHISNANCAEYKLTSITKQDGSTASQLLSVFFLSHKEIQRLSTLNNFFLSTTFTLEATSALAERLLFTNMLHTAVPAKF